MQPYHAVLQNLYSHLRTGTAFLNKTKEKMFAGRGNGWTKENVTRKKLQRQSSTLPELVDKAVAEVREEEWTAVTPNKTPMEADRIHHIGRGGGL
ncbi:hypothetical protein BaRGS_00013861 [Batillaria attramentaria]|uniref:Uncharacterized protein n=1 Tax=Batillaria attramentaria TaxID=370345 RepID=A0ABD0L738_9CAEN